MTEPKRETEATRPEVIDTDVHESGPGTYLYLLPYLEKKWHKYITDYDWAPEQYSPYRPTASAGTFRADAKDAETHVGGADLVALRKDLFDDAGVSAAVLAGVLNASQLSPSWSEFKTAVMSAQNDWEIAEWIEKDSRFYGSIHVNVHDVAGAVREIDRLGDHPRMVQVMIFLGQKAYGDPEYHPIYEAAQRHDITVSFHQGGNTTTTFGYHRYYIEWKSLVFQAFQSQLTSLIFEGVFDKFPRLRVGMIEGGFTWVPSLMWRLDQHYRQHAYSEVPWVKRLPSDIIREQVKFATQPMEQISSRQLLQTVENMGTDELLVFSTDYPHYDFDPPMEAFPSGIPNELLTKIWSGNARALYPRIPTKL